MKIERDDAHRYWFVEDATRKEGIGVTRALVEANIVDDAYFTDLSRGRGKLVHLFAEMILTNTLDRPVDASILGYLVGLRKFLDNVCPTVNGAEVIAGHVDRLLAGTCDLDVVMMGGPAVVELKTSPPTAWHALQLAPYAYLLDGPKWLSRGRFGLYLNGNGGFKLKEYDEQRDLDLFFNAHNTLAWRINHGTFEKPYGRKPVDPEPRTGVDITDPSVHDGIGDWRSGPDGDFSDW